MHHYDVTLMNPTVLSGMFIGSMMTFLFCGLTMNAVGRAAARMVAEVRRQFREIKGILTGETEPDYERCVAISTKGAQREMVVPSLLAIIAPVPADWRTEHGVRAGYLHGQCRRRVGQCEEVCRGG